LYGEVRADIRRALEAAGNDPKSLPKELWKEIEAKERRVFALLLIGFGMASMNNWFDWHEEQDPGGMDRDGADKQFTLLADRRATWAARTVNRTTRKKLIHRMKTYEPGESMRSVIQDVIPDSRIVTATRTEMQAAQGLGPEAIRRESRRIYKKRTRVHSVLMLGACEHCLVCPLFHRVDMKFVREFFPSAMPIHPNCCCRQVLVFGLKKEVLAEGLMIPNPDRREIIRAMAKQGFKVPQYRRRS